SRAKPDAEGQKNTKSCSRKQTKPAEKSDGLFFVLTYNKPRTLILCFPKPNGRPLQRGRISQPGKTQSLHQF
ncbi:hypothetical protein IWQ51_005529, partial [Labrenzia sp. EL_142]|nr:hypothetical protein [Labrenzia sp. EL_142]